MIPNNTNPKIDHLKFKNALTQKPTKIQISPTPISFYICGPTVYAPPHLGHARTYITFDIIRRIISKYFSMNITLAMNITDVDDKIIRATRENFFFKSFLTKHISPISPITPISISKEEISQKIHSFYTKTLLSLSETETNIKSSQSIAKENNNYKELNDLKEELLTIEYKIMNTNTDFETFKQSILTIEELTIEELITGNKTIIGIYLNYIFNNNIKEEELINDLPLKEDYSKFALENENIFFYEMKRINVDVPDIVCRCTEYIKPMLEMVDKLLKAGLAYEDKGSVYMDINKYINITSSSSSLNDSNYLNNLNNLNIQKKENEKLFNYGNFFKFNNGKQNNSSDFALWKSADTQPVWDSSVGPGRPGWHLECSAMAQEIFGDKLNIHGGGVDLKFPHHENEIVQCNAINYINKLNILNNSNIENKINIEKDERLDWCDVFIHSGHLNISGQKMSKSLKNFITISDLFDMLSSPASKFIRSHFYPSFSNNKTEKGEKEIIISNIIRILFVNAGEYSGTMNFEMSQLTESENHYKKIHDFFLKFKALRQKNNSLKYFNKKSEKNNSNDILIKLLSKTKGLVRKYFMNDFAFKKVFKSLMDLIEGGNKYMRKREIFEIDYELVGEVIEYIKGIFGVLGVVVGGEVMGDVLGEEEKGMCEGYSIVREEIRRVVKGNRDIETGNNIFNFFEEVERYIKGGEGRGKNEKRKVVGKIFGEVVREMKEVFEYGSGEMLKVLDKFRDEKWKEFGIQIQDFGEFCVWV